MTDTKRNSPTVALIGATGGMGAFILSELSRRQVPVRVVQRRDGAVSATDGVVPVLADVYDTDELSRALAGVSTVISAFNPGWNSDNLYERYREGARSIRNAARQAGVSRLLIIGGASSLYDLDGHQLIESFTPPEPYASGVKAARDDFEETRDEDELDWVYLSPPLECGPVGPTGRTGRYRIGTDNPVIGADGRSSLSREDLAVAVVDEVGHPAHHRTRFTVGY